MSRAHRESSRVEARGTHRSHSDVRGAAACKNQTGELQSSALKSHSATEQPQPRPVATIVDPNRDFGWRSRARSPSAKSGARIVREQAALSGWWARDRASLGSGQPSRSRVSGYTQEHTCSVQQDTALEGARGDFLDANQPATSLDAQAPWFRATERGRPQAAPPGPSTSQSIVRIPAHAMTAVEGAGSGVSSSRAACW